MFNLKVKLLLQARALSVCCVDWSPGRCDQLAAALSDGSLVLYDVRHSKQPLAYWGVHERAASYVKFYGPDHIVSASIDGTVQLWNATDVLTAGIGIESGLTAQSSINPPAPQASEADMVIGYDERRTHLTRARTFSGHVNTKNFVGLAVLPEEGLLATGSEDGFTHVYQQSWDVPMLQHALDTQPDTMVTAVAWQPLAASKQSGHGPTLASATSDGLIHVISLCS